MVVVVADPRFVPRDRTRRLNAPDEPGRGQCSQHVVHGLTGDLGQNVANRTEDAVGVGVLISGDRLQYRDPGPGHPQLGRPQLFGEIKGGLHSAILYRFLE